MDNKSLIKLSYGLYYIGVKNGEKINACVANTAIQVTAQPPKLSVTLNKNNFTTSLIGKAGMFTVSVIDDSVSLDDIARFGFASGADKNKFEGFDSYKTFDNGLPYITKSVCAAIAVKVEARMDCGTHITFMGSIVDAITVGEGTPLTYADYHNKKKGSTPPKAPSYVEEKREGEAWRCSVCGYIHNGALPDGFTCPVCKQPKEVFVKI